MKKLKKTKFYELVDKIWKVAKKDKRVMASLVFILLFTIGSTFAFFSASLGGGTSAKINATTGVTDSLMFSVGKDIEIKATMDNFQEGMESLHGETTATATLIANDVTNTAKGRYNVFFIIDDNDFEYSTEDGKTELLLTVTDPNGNEVEYITGLKRVEGGFDITTRTGGFLIMADYDIETTTTESQTWKLEVTFVNLDADQNQNKGKALHGRFYITTEKLETYETIKINNIEAKTTYNSITASLISDAGTAEVDKYYYAIEQEGGVLGYLEKDNSLMRLSNAIAVVSNYIESDQPTYTFSALAANTHYKVYAYVKDVNGVSSNVFETEITTNAYYLPVIDSVTTSNTTTSITVNANLREGTVAISKYYYSIDDGDFIESDDTSHTFDGLDENTTHTIKVKAIDDNGKESEVYTIEAKTIALASITNVTTSVTDTTVVVNVTATKGDANIASYKYSIDGGTTWVTTNESSHTFDNLTSNTTYTIKVKVVDTEGRESSEASATAKTEYVLAMIDKVTHSSTLNSITVNVTARAGSNAISKYYYSKDNGANYEESDSSSYTFNDLLDTTEYKIKIKVKDSDGRYSTEYYESIATVTYNNPSVTTVNVDKTYNSISLTTTAAKGTNNVAKYYYKVDNGNWSEAQTTNTYNITGLSENTKYTIKVKVEDTIGRESNEYTLEVTTNTYEIPSVSATTSATATSITISATGTNGDGNIAKYMYSKDGGSNWITQDSTSLTDSYTFENLTAGTTFQIRVKVVDNNNRESTVYSTTATTDYLNPTVSIISIDKTATTIKVDAKGTNGSGTIAKYMYSSDGGNTWATHTSTLSTDSYTFAGLSNGTTYQIRVKVVDNNNRESEVESRTISTSPDITIATTYNGSTGAPSTVGAIANLSCSGATGTYNAQYDRIEITNTSQDKGNCTLTYTDRTSKTYLNNKIINLAGTTQGDGQVVHEMGIVQSNKPVNEISQGAYQSYKTYSASSYSATSGTTVSNVFTFSSSQWQTTPANMTSGTYYHLSFNLAYDSYYEACYTLGKGYSSNTLYFYQDSTAIISSVSASTSSDTSACIKFRSGTGSTFRVVQRAYSNTSYGISTVKFSLKKLSTSTIDTGYRYEGKNPNNYVWFNNELWRIIGVFDSSSHGQSGNLVKIIRNESIGSPTWNKAGTNNWNTSSLKALLNGAYYNQQDGTNTGYCFADKGETAITCDYRKIGISSKYRGMIKNVIWYLGGFSINATDANYGVANADEYYTFERGNYVYSGNPTSTTGYIGLIYSSDYAYSVLASDCSRNTMLSSYSSTSCSGQSWLYKGYGYYVTISPLSSSNEAVSAIFQEGRTNGLILDSSEPKYPVLYLDSSVYVVSGDGSITNPYIIGM